MSPRSQGRGRRLRIAGRRPRRSLRAGICCGLLILAGALAGSTAAPASAAPNDVLVVGDSLAVGTEPYLAPMLPGRNIVTAIKSGITTPIGMEYIRRKLQDITPQTVVISLGSNDGSDPHRFADRLRRTMELLPDDSCVIWATIIRPARKGAYRGLNRVLNQARRDDPRIVLIDWQHAVTQGSVFLPDALHPDAAGFRYRAEMIANAINTECVAAGLDGS
jgi:lysophospholipase L1-like esterase